MTERVVLRNSTGEPILIGQPCRIGKRPLYGKYARAVQADSEDGFMNITVIAEASIEPNKRGTFMVVRS